jgi:hypothetical protein
MNEVRIVMMVLLIQLLALQQSRKLNLVGEAVK